jgi:hypothetical protein
MHAALRTLAVMTALAPTACSFDFGYGGTRYRCGLGDTCPPGFMCVGGFCEQALDAPGGDGGGGDGSVSGVCGNLSLLRDDFEVAGRGPFFNQFTDPGATLTETGGQLVLDFAAGTNTYAGYNSSHFYDLHSGWLETSVAEVLSDDTILEVRNHLGNTAQLVHEAGDIYAGIFNVSGQGTLAQRAWNPAEKFWRIREDQGDMVWELSTDRATWSILHRRALPFDVSHVRGVVGGGGQFTAASRARFDDVNLPAANALFCPLEQLVDDFAAAPLGPNFEPYTNAGCTVAETGGNLTFTYTNGTGNIFCGITSMHYFDLSRGTGIVVDSMGLPAIANFVTYVQLSIPGGGGSTQLETTLENTSIEFRLYTSGTIADRRQVTYDRTAHRYWRTRGEGATAIFETSPDRAAWTERWRVTTPFALSPVDLNIGAGHYANVTVPLSATISGVNAN